MNYLQIILETLVIALCSAIISTNTINGVKSAIGIDNHFFNRLLTLVIDLFITYWIYWRVVGLADWLEFAVVCVFCYSGADAIYNTIGKLKETRDDVKEV